MLRNSLKTLLLIALAAVSTCCSSVSADEGVDVTKRQSDDLLRRPLSHALFLEPRSPHVQRYLQKKDKDEVFAFVLECDSSVWAKFDWVKLTTVALVSFLDLDLLAHAHDNGVKVVNLANIPKSDLVNATTRSEWVANQVEGVLEMGLDGVNLDFEDTIDPGSPEQAGYTSLVKELREALDIALPEAQLSVDVAWSAEGIDGRYYDYAGLAQYSDLLFVMAYDEQSQIWDEPCDARANSPLDNAMEGILSYQALGIESSKLVLGLPWYGYWYNCTEYFSENETCLIEKVPFRGCNCSDAAGRQYEYHIITNYVTDQNVTVQWDADSRTPYFTVTSGDLAYQIWYDNPRSLQDKILYARNAGLAGAGMWAANFLDYSDTEEGQQQRDAMWGVMP